MKKEVAIKLLKELEGKSYYYITMWGLSTARLAIWTIRNRKSSTRDERMLADEISYKIIRKW